MAGRAFSDIAPLTRYRLLFGAALGGSMLAALLCLFYWFTLDPARSLQVSMPGGDGRPKDGAGKGKSVDLAGVFTAGEGVAADLPGAWPRFRGPDFDNIVKAEVKLAGSWGAEGPKRLWDVELGEGHAAAVVLNGRVYVLDYDEEKRADTIRCLSLADGKEIWRRAYSVAIKRNHGMSRTIPAVTEDALVTVGPKCHVVCLDPKTGDFRWGLSMVDQLGATEPLWYTGQCPLIDEGKVIVAPGGPDALLAAVDCATGQVVWKTPNPDKWKMSHSSVLPLTLAGTRMYVYAAVGGVVGVSPADGKVLWSAPWNAEVVAASPVALDGDRVFCTAGYGAGGVMLRVTAKDGGFAAEVLDKHTAAEGFACEQQTPIFWGGLLYGIKPKDAGALRGQFVCYKPDGTLVWSSGQANRYGLGPFVLADGKFYVLSDDGTLTVLEASAEKFVEVGRAKVLDGQDAWGPIAIAGTRMIVRDSKRMVCLEVGAERVAALDGGEGPEGPKGLKGQEGWQLAMGSPHPAPLPRERETVQRVAQLQYLDPVEVFLPLPLGERWGEGFRPTPQTAHHYLSALDSAFRVIASSAKQPLQPTATPQEVASSALRALLAMTRKGGRGLVAPGLCSGRALAEALTPPLSQGERESVVGEGRVSGEESIATTCWSLAPSPWGEGWGEGEGIPLACTHKLRFASLEGGTQDNHKKQSPLVILSVAKDPFGDDVESTLKRSFASLRMTRGGEVGV